MKRTCFNLLWLWAGLYSLALNAAPPVLSLTTGYGVDVHPGLLQAGDLVRIHNAGFTWVRTDLQWQTTESSPGVYDFTAFDALAANLAANGLQLVVILDYGNSLYASPGDTAPFLSLANTDGFRAAYAAFSTAAVAHYAGRGFIWEQWNEPNIAKFWPPAPASAVYVALMKQTCAQIRKQFPQEIIIGPATSGIDLTFIEACLQGGMLDYWSAISVHPYRQTAPETAAADYAALRTLIAKYAPAGSTVPIICSEWGYSTAWPGIDENTQADYLTRMFQFNRQQNIPLTIWYDWRDDGTDPTNPEHHFGLVRYSATTAFVAKPAYLAVSQLLTGAPPTPPTDAQLNLQSAAK